MDCSLPNSSVHGILESRILEWAANPFSRRSSQPRDGTWSLHWRQILYHLKHQESSSIHFCLNQKEITILKFVYYRNFGFVYSIFPYNFWLALAQLVYILCYLESIPFFLELTNFQISFRPLFTWIIIYPIVFCFPGVSECSIWLMFVAFIT